MGGDPSLSVFEKFLLLLFAMLSPFIVWVAIDIIYDFVNLIVKNLAGRRPRDRTVYQPEE